MDNMSSFHDILLQQIVPALGVCTGTFMSFAPFRAVLQASRDGHLGDLNPTPWVFMLGNAVGWLAYSFMIENIYVFLPNAPSFILAIWLNIQAIKLQYENFRSNELQNAIIAALEEQSKKKLKVEEVEQLVENVVAEEVAAADILLPMSTAPIMADEEMPNVGRSRSNTFDPSFFQSKTPPARANSFHTTYSSTTSSTSSPSIASRIEGQKSHVINVADDNRDERDDGATTVFEEAADAIVDYASFIWDIAIQKTPAPASHEIIVLSISTFWLVLITIAALGRPMLDENSRTLLIGLAVNANLVFFYGAPLSKIATVIESKASGSIHIPTMIASLLNGTLWLCYGIAVSDYFISVPNGLRTLLGIVQLILCVLYPRHGHTSRESDGSIPEAMFYESIHLPEESAPLI